MAKTQPSGALVNCHSLDRVVEIINEETPFSYAGIDSHIYWTAEDVAGEWAYESIIDSSNPVDRDPKDVTEDELDAHLDFLAEGDAIFDRDEAIKRGMAMARADTGHVAIYNGPIIGLACDHEEAEKVCEQAGYTVIPPDNGGQIDWYDAEDGPGVQGYERDGRGVFIVACEEYPGD